MATEFETLIATVNDDHRVAREVLGKLPELITAGENDDVVFDLGTDFTVPSIAKLQKELQTGGLQEVQEVVRVTRQLSQDNAQQLYQLAVAQGREIISPYYEQLKFKEDGAQDDILYRARTVNSMVSFPFTAFNIQALERKYDTQGAKIGPILLPPHEEVVEKKWTSYVSGTGLNVSAYPAFTRTVTGYRRHWYRRYYGYYYYWWRYYYGYYWSSYVTSYTYQVTSNLSGSMTAQTFQVPDSRVVLGIQLATYVPNTYIWTANPILYIVNSDQGKPTLEGSILAKGELVSNAAASSTGAGSICTWKLDRPVLVEAGKSYAIIVKCNGNFWVQYSLNQHSLGGCFYTQDGIYWNSDLAKDLAFGLIIADFGAGINQFVIELDSVSLDGGIASIDSQIQMDNLSNTDFNVTVSLNNGVDWQPLSVMNEIKNLPSYTPVQGNFNGSQYVMPLLDMTLSQLTAFRPDNGLRYFTVQKPVPVNRILKVTYNLAGFNPTYNTFTPKLRLDVNTQLNPLTTLIDRSDDGSATKVDCVFEIPVEWDTYGHDIAGYTDTATELFNIMGIMVVKG